MKNIKKKCTIVAVALLLALPAAAQSGSSSLAGRVADSSGLVMPGVNVTIINEGTKDSRTMPTNDSGEFVFVGIIPGTYTVRVQAQGFRPFERTGNVVVSSTRLAVGTIQLEVGTVTESVLVTAQGAQVQTDSSEKSELIDLKELTNLASRGRDPVTFLSMLPGTQQGQNPDFLGGFYGTTLPTFQGLPTSTSNLLSDGVNGGDGQGGGIYSGTVNMDSIAEVRVLMNNYNAEYGHGGGIIMNLITKSGARDYHGSGWWYKRHEMFNANNFFNKNSVNTQFPQGTPKNINRAQDIGADLSGPVFVPKILPLSKTRDKLFFFFLFEDDRLKQPVKLERWTMPTQLERTGDFSKSFNGASLITVKDPLTGTAFANNVIPTSRFNKYSMAMENMLNLPNFTPPAGSGTYNYLFQENAIPMPRQSISTKIDYHPTNSDTLSFTWKYWCSNMTGIHIPSAPSNWGFVDMEYLFCNWQSTINWTKVISAHLVNELFAGGLHDTENSPPYGPDCNVNGCGQYNPMKRKNYPTLLELGQWNGKWNFLNFIPKSSYGGVPASYSAATIQFDGRDPLTGYDSNITFKDDFTYIRGAHTIKLGASRERGRFGQQATSNFSGSFQFDNSSLDPITTGYAFANAYLGHYYTYSEDLGRGPDNGRKITWAEYIQDTWKPKSNLTLDFGLRIYETPWPLQSDGVASQFSMERFDPTWGGNPPVLYTPAFNTAGQRAAIDPRYPNVFLPQAYIGNIVYGTGSTCTDTSITNPCKLNGIVVQNDPTYVTGHGFKQMPGPQLDPRFGVAWDPFKDGKTAVRAALGVFHQAMSSANMGQDRGPAFVYTRQLLSGTADPSMFGGTAVTSPISITNGYERANAKVPSILQYSLNIQRTLMKNFFVSVGYVGNTQHFVYEPYNWNVLPYGYQFQPQNLDPTSTATPKAPLATALIEPVKGFTSISQSHPAARTRYDSLQWKLQRRFASGLELDFFFTWAKNFGYYGWSQLIDVKNLWGLTSTDQTFASNIAFVYPFPKGSKLVGDNRITRGVLDGWQLSGNIQFGSGFPQNISLTTSDSYNFTGGGDIGEQVLLSCNPQLPHGSRNFSRFLNTSCVQAPYRNANGMGTSGNFLGSNLNGNAYRGPGFNNVDMTMFKTFTFGKEGRESITFRWEVYNIANHAEASAVNNTARFSPTGVQQLANFGQVNATQPERRMQMALRFNF